MKPGNRSKRSARRIEKARHNARRRRKRINAIIGEIWDGPAFTAALVDAAIERDKQAKAEWKAAAP